MGGGGVCRDQGGIKINLIAISNFNVILIGICNYSHAILYAGLCFVEDCPCREEESNQQVKIIVKCFIRCDFN